MSPLARFRQGAVCTLLLILLSDFAVALEPVPPAPTQPPSNAQSVQPVILAPKSTAQIARSALVVIDGTAADDSFQLKIRRAGDGHAIESSNVTVTVDGKNEPVTHESAGIYTIPVNDLRGDGSRDPARDIDIIVTHDGIREILSGKVAVTEAPSAGGLLGDHKQMAWWILNIAIVLIAGIVITRRKG